MAGNEFNNNNLSGCFFILLFGFLLAAIYLFLHYRTGFPDFLRPNSDSVRSIELIKRADIGGGSLAVRPPPASIVFREAKDVPCGAVRRRSGRSRGLVDLLHYFEFSEDLLDKFLESNIYVDVVPGADFDVRNVSAESGELLALFLAQHSLLLVTIDLVCNENDRQIVDEIFFLIFDNFLPHVRHIFQRVFFVFVFLELGMNYG